jgi:Plasmid encoded RepA protein
VKQLSLILKGLPLAKEAKRRSRQEPVGAVKKRLLLAAEEIRQAPADADRAFMARELVQCTLPHTNPGNVEAWQRRNGNLSLIIQPGWDSEKGRSIGYPYGTIPRLLLFWITTEAVRTRKRRLELAHTLSEFMRQLDLDPSHGGKRSDAHRLRDQMERLLRCRITFQESTERPNGWVGRGWSDMQVAPDGYLWWNLKEPEQGTLWGSWIELGEKFFEAIIAAPVPVDLRALRALKKSPLALDLYAWATYRVFRMTKPQFIPWKGLRDQIGTDYREVDEFARNAKLAFRKIRIVYPALKLQMGKGGFYLLPSPSAVHGKKDSVPALARPL